MLKTLKEFRESLNEEQRNMFHNAFPEDIVKQFFASEDEGSATTVAAELNRYLGSRPLVAISLYKQLSSEQRALISDMAFDEDDE